jgi:tetratricopeptide (TPR) repeat protein
MAVDRTGLAGPGREARSQKPEAGRDDRNGFRSFSDGFNSGFWVPDSGFRPVPQRQLRWASNLLIAVAIAAACTRLAVAASSGRDAVSQGNALYGQGQYDRAISLYDQVLTENPKLDQARFNKADAFFRMDDLAKAIDLYSEVSAQTKDMDLVRKAKYNLGNAHFQRGLKQRDSDLQKALEDLRTSITYWRAVLDMDPSNENAKKNKEIAGLVIKDILDELKKKQDPNKPGDRSQESGDRKEQQQKQDPSQTQKSEDRSQKSEDKKQGQDPNQKPEDRSQNSEQKKRGQDPNQAKDPNQNSEPKAQNSEQKQQIQASDATAQEILDREQQQKKERENRVRVRRVPVDKDW